MSYDIFAILFTIVGFGLMMSIAYKNLKIKNNNSIENYLKKIKKHNKNLQ